MLSAMVVDPGRLPAEKIRPLSREEYERMVDLGFFDEDEHVELLDGVLVKMSPQGWQHAAIIEWLTGALQHDLDPTLALRVQLPFVAGRFAVPEPDFAIVPRDRNRRAHPERALLIVEVSGDSIGTDREVKGALYARAGVPEYWLVNVDDTCIEVYTEPTPTGFARKQLLYDGEVLRPILLPTVAIAIADMPR